MMKRSYCQFEFVPGVYLLPVADGTARLLNFGGKFYSINRTARQYLEIALDEAPEQRLKEFAQRDIQEIEIEYFQLLDQLLRCRVLRPHHERERQSPVTARCWTRAAALPIRGALRMCPSRLQAWFLLALARCSFACLGWSRTVALWSQCFPLFGKSNSTASEMAISRQIHQNICRAASLHVLRVACKERALCCWVLLRSAGVANELVVGATLLPVTSHAWCECHGQILSDFADHCDRFVPVVRFS